MFNTNDYRHLTEQIIKKVRKDGVDSITGYCALTGIPLVCVFEIVAEEMPEYAEHCAGRIKQIKEFMGMK